ncbi:EcsC family protein [Tenacibaculum agarivorans]|uniref:EcsC family protein n=1 Tax=Tenacibaculum agarivorans TaxID=1908389 RepID=UPI00094B9480|nr:EcsC family protein [Tenacibaculum agarivorans]
MKQLTKEELEALQVAKQLLENPGIAMKITKTSLLKATDAAIFTLKQESGAKHQNLLHKITAGTAGAVGGLFGIAGLAVELPITTTIILRSVADIARSNGEIISAPETKLACLEVFALGGNSIEESTLESGYYATRTFLSNSMSQATRYVTEQGIINEGAPLFLNIIGKIAKKFGVQVTEKTIAQSIPVIGAAGGALINTLFISHFQDMAKGHFTIRKLERKYGSSLIEELYKT